MWLFFGVTAITFALLNVSFMALKKETKWFRFISMAFTALTLCDFYSDCADRVLREDWSGLMDIVPASSQALWVCTLISIALNGASLINRKTKL